MRGNGQPSLIDAIRCDSTDWVLFVVLQLVCAIFTAIGIVVVNAEYKEKVENGYQFVEGDFESTPKGLALMIGISFFGSFAAAFCGIGPGAIFCPILVIIGI